MVRAIIIRVATGGQGERGEEEDHEAHSHSYGHPAGDPRLARLWRVGRPIANTPEVVVAVHIRRAAEDHAHRVVAGAVYEAVAVQ